MSEKGKLLLVDNDADYRQSLSSFLQLEDHAVVQAASVEEAGGRIKTEPVDLAMVDLRLTNDDDDLDFSGLEVANKAGELGIPCIVITAFPTVEATRRALRSRGKAGRVEDFVPKTGGPEAILKAIESVPLLDHFALLHVSDPHFQPPADGLVFDQKWSQRALRRDLAQLRRDGAIGRVKAVVVSGDSVYQGQTGGFEAAWGFMSDLCADLKIPSENVILVPGNHDLDRRATEKGLAKYKDYLRYTVRFYDEPAFTREEHYRIFDFGRVAIVALNSCHREAEPSHRGPACEEEHYHGWIDERQLDRAMEELDRVLDGREALRLAVCHHHVLHEFQETTYTGDHVPHEGQGTTCTGDHLLNYDDSVKYQLAGEDIRILLHGHGHKALLRQPTVPGTGMPYTFGSGTMLVKKSDKEPDKRLQYLILDLGPRDDGSRVIMRKYVPSIGDRLGTWTADESVRADGIIRLTDVILGR